LKPKGKAKTEQLASYRFSSVSEMFQQYAKLPQLNNIEVIHYKYLREENKC